MKKLIEWLRMSNRWKHLLGGLIIGIFAFGWFTAMYAGVLTAGALEYKDKAYGSKWDWIPFATSIACCASFITSYKLTIRELLQLP